ncbi:MAG: A24 family peptidase [Anaerolineae bacterium]|nr:A24 family peptidase [Anaerolineae bacterium]
MTDLIFVILVGLIGILSGGVVNVLADDLPHRRKPRLPHYPDDTPRPVSAWLGLTAFALGQRRSPGGTILSWRYPLVEITTTVLMILTVLVTQNDPDVSTTQLIFYLVYMALFVLITVIDVEHRLILFVVIIPSSLIAILDAILTPAHSRPDLGEALTGGLVGFGVFFVLYLGGILFSYVVSKMQGYELPEVAFGYGDVMLSTVCGLILGWQPLIFAMFITVFLGAAGAIVYLVVRKLSGRYDMFTPLPYGPYIVIGTLIMLLFSDQVRAFLQ